MPEVSDLIGFREETLDKNFEQPARMTFTLEGVRSDDPPLDTDLEWTYTVNGVVLLRGFLRTLNEVLSDEEDYQQYVLTDRWHDVSREAFILSGSARVTLNADNTFANDGTGPQDTLGELIELIAGTSAILTGSPKVSWPVSAPTDKVERNIDVEGRSIADLIVEFLRYNPAFRLYYGSATNQLIFKDLLNPTVKTVKLNKMHGSWHQRTGAPPFSDVCRIDLLTDKADCYENVRLEGFGIFKKVTVDLEPAWECEKTPPYFPLDFVTDACMAENFAKKFKLPAGVIPAEFSFDDKGRATSGQMLELEAYIPQRNTGQCVTIEDDPSVGVFDDALCEERWEMGTGNEWQWTDYEWYPVGQADVPLPDAEGDYIIWTQDRMMSLLNVWTEHAEEVHMGGGPMLPSDPRVEPWKLRATLWIKEGGLVITKSGGCPNGTTYQRVNRDWVKVTITDDEGSDVIIRDDTANMTNMANKLFAQIGRPKVSGTITIYLHLVTPTAVLEGPIKVSPTGGVNVGNPGAIWELGDALNIIYDPTETLAGPGIIPDYGGPGVDVDWENLEISVMGVHYNRREQTLVIDVANTPFVFGDRLSEGLQR